MHLKRVLIANRGEIAVRLIKTCRKLSITSIAIYVEEDADALHVRTADAAFVLDKPGSNGYLDVANIVDICKRSQAQAVLPGYGFLSENAAFAQALQAAGVLFVGPAVQTLLDFGLKHTARHIAKSCDVPIVPGTEMITSVAKAKEVAASLGFPIMVKATAGGGGMGLQVCRDDAELVKAVELVRSRGNALFGNEGMFLERYVETGRHIETQVFGNGQGDVIFLGERECSIQRRHQKVIEECPSPFVFQRPHIRDRLREVSLRLASAVKLKSVSTIEFLVDNTTGDFYFLEVNTRLQVEHGITELCYNIDLVELMLLQADGELQGHGGVSKELMRQFERDAPTGNAMEVRVYAENPAKDYVPTPGLLQNVSFPQRDGVRVDSWIETGTVVSPSFDPLLAKVMVHQQTREQAVKSMQAVLREGCVQGPPNNIDFLLAILETDAFRSGETTTTMLSTFSYDCAAIEFLEPGTFTNVQDYPGRVGVPNGVPPSGPMDSLSFRIANILAGNPEGTEGFEITLIGPTIKFYSSAVIAVCGAPFTLTIDKKPAALWARHTIAAGAEVSVGQSATGARAYLAIKGGLPGVASYLGSKSTTPALNWGGYQGRCIRTGDFLLLEAAATSSSPGDSLELPSHLIPKIDSSPSIYTLPGPYFDREFLTDQGRRHLLSYQYRVSPASSRSGVRLDGPPPQWSRSNGGEGGSHPSNMVGFGNPEGGLQFTGDVGVAFSVDQPSQTGYIITQTTCSTDLWRLGQLRPGDGVSFRGITWEQSQVLQRRMREHLVAVRSFVASPSINTKPFYPLDWSLPPSSHQDIGDGILHHSPATSTMDALTIRQAGDRALLCIFGPGTFSLKLRARVQQLSNAIAALPATSGLATHGASENVSYIAYFDPAMLTQSAAISQILSLTARLPSLDTAKLPSRVFHLPALFDARETHASVARYMAAQRPRAAYLPDNVDFIRRCNGLSSKADVKEAFFETPHVVNAVGWLSGLPIYLPLDPRKRLLAPKYNPSRTSTAAGSLGLGGNTCAVYPHDAPGGYVLWGLTLPGCCWDIFGRKPGFAPAKPWLFEPFDQIVFHEVSRAEFEAAVRSFKAGTYRFRVEDAEIDMAAYSALEASTAAEAAKLKQTQAECNAREAAEDLRILREWEAEKTAQQASEAADRTAAAPSGAEDLTAAFPHAVPVTSSMSASIWKLHFAAGDVVAAGEEFAVLEAMKMEISVRTPSGAEGEGGRWEVAAVLKQPGERVEAGDVIALLLAEPGQRNRAV